MKQSQDWGEIQPLYEIATPHSLSIDAEGGVLRGVRIIGRVSLNGREYTPAALTKAKGMYEGRVVNFDHPDRSKPTAERSVSSRFGWLQGVHEANDGLEGDLYYLKTHPMAGQVVEAAQRNPGLFGLSHNADGRIVKRDGKTLVEEIIGVRSVDLVADPATTKSLFESLQHEEPPATVSISEALAALFTTDEQAATLQEMVDAKMVPDAPMATGGDATGQMKAAFRAMVLAVLDDESMDTNASVARIREILKAQEKLIGGESADSQPQKTKESEDMTEEQQAEMKAIHDKLTEALAENQKLKGEAQARSLLEAANVELSDVRIQAVAAIADDGAKKALVESWPKRQPAEKPRSTAPVVESAAGEWKAPADPKETAKRLKKR
ncbi:MAG: hypothetical protein WC655_25000 [Candidatus Hydrogenedentales bacterium]|jgi:hypothetical protein